MTDLRPLLPERTTRVESRSRGGFLDIMFFWVVAMVILLCYVVGEGLIPQRRRDSDGNRYLCWPQTIPPPWSGAVQQMDCILIDHTIARTP